ncbi:hypothetical protein TEA_007545 [Camellia sinensis var. sinensis]|uniref:Uncharacterized protein n=1 Tax=Camellia sinensis var. sinensis TaxID=542762 RepID=A0A4V3WJR4_CAMSN|nr:hypothetical protein TEA_007545 [Camellia sinensis var. sinensis]
MVVEGWAPQLKILLHPSIGGFVSHCGWSSVMEGMKFGSPIIAMPMHLDQPVNARLVEEIGVGMEAVRDKNRVLDRKNVAEVIQKVVVEDGGEAVRSKARELSETTQNPVAQLQAKFKEWNEGFKAWLAKQSLPMEAAVITATSAA